MHRIPLFAFVAGLVAIYLAERAFEGTVALAMLVVGVLAFLTSLGVSIVRLVQAPAESRAVHRHILVCQAGCALALAMYAATREPFSLFAPGSAPHTIVTVAWPGLLLLCVLPAIAMEAALLSMRQSPKIESFRIRLAFRAALTVSLGVVGFAGLNYAASEWNRTFDVSYFKTTKAGSATQALLENLTNPVHFVLFFPPSNEVLEQARAYVEPLTHHSPLVTMEIVDHALVPDLAKDMKVRNNGFLVIHANERNESIRLGLEVDKARSALRTLDSQVHTKLLELLRPPRVAYLTVGHAERDWVSASDDHRALIKLFKQELELLGFSVKRLGLGEGLGAKVPDDATVVIAVGPLEPFSAAEQRSLVDYASQGGRLLVLFDPLYGQPPAPWMSHFGLRFDADLIADDRFILRIPGTRESVYNIASANTMTHPSVRTLAALGRREAVAFGGTGSFETLPHPKDELQVRVVLRSMSNSWKDTEKNGRLDADEKRHTWNLVVAVEGQVKAASGDEIPTNTIVPQDATTNTAEDSATRWEEDAAEPGTANTFRGVFVGDAEVISDARAFRGNRIFVHDVLRWLAGDEEAGGEVESEKDLPIVHRKEEDAVWFYGSSFIIPAFILGLGLSVSRRRRRARRK